MSADQWKRFVDKAVDVLQRHTTPGGLTDFAALMELYDIFDGPEFRAMGTIPQLQCDARQERAASETRQIETLKSIGSQAAPEEVRNQALEEAAKQCEDIYSWRGAFTAGVLHTSCLNTCASAIRSHKRTSTDQANADTGSAE